MQNMLHATQSLEALSNYHVKFPFTSNVYIRNLFLASYASILYLDFHNINSFLDQFIPSVIFLKQL